MDTIKHNRARLYNWNEIGNTIVQHKHTKILRLKRVKYLLFNPQNGDRY